MGTIFVASPAIPAFTGPVGTNFGHEPRLATTRFGETVVVVTTVVGVAAFVVVGAA